jgi:hypothetical protein
MKERGASPVDLQLRAAGEQIDRQRSRKKAKQTPQAQRIGEFHKHAPAPQQRERPVDVASAHSVEGEIQPIRLGMAHHLYEIVLPIVDRDGPKLGEDRTLASGGNATHLQAGERAQVEKCRAASAARADDQQLVVCLDLRTPV